MSGKKKTPGQGGSGAGNEISGSLLTAQKHSISTDISQLPLLAAATKILRDRYDLPKAALMYAGHGIPVFPCDQTTKRPKTKHGFRDATTNKQRITQWWRKWPAASIGIPTGSTTGVFVLDVDVSGDKIGQRSIDELVRLHGHLPDTLTVITGGGGHHYYFRMPNFNLRNSASKLGTDLDIRANGGYVIVPPSGHVSGKIYAFHNHHDIAPAPAWLLDTLRQDICVPYSNTTYTDDLRPGDDYNQRGDIGDLLRRHGWTQGRTVGNNVRWTRPGKQPREGHSATWDVGRRTFYVFSGSAPPFEAEKAYSPFQVYAFLECSGDYRAAAQELARQGYGVRAQTKALKASESFESFESSRKHLKAVESSLKAVESSTAATSQLASETNRVGSIANMVKDFVESGEGTFQTKDVVQYIGAHSRNEKQAVYLELNRLKKISKINKVDGKYGVWERVITDIEEMSLDDPGEPLQLELPLGIHELTNIYPGNIILIAGEPNSGKTAFAIAFLVQLLTSARSSVFSLSMRIKETHLLKPENSTNQQPPPKFIRYLNSEMSGGELRNRLEATGIPLDVWQRHVSFIERHADYHQLILPDGINIIDYLELPEYTEAAQLIQQIHAKLNNGIAIILMQKNPGVPHAVGGHQTKAKPRLVINLTSNGPYGGIAKLIKVKAPVDYRSKPQGKERDYQITPAGEFRPLSGWRFVNAKQRQKINEAYHDELREIETQKQEAGYDCRI